MNYFFLIILTAFISIIVVAIRTPKNRIAEENGLIPVFEEICGARIGFMNYTAPLVRHSIYNDFVVIKCLGGCYVIPRVSATFEADDGIISSGIRYISSKYIGQELRIWTKSKDKVLELLVENS